MIYLNYIRNQKVPINKTSRTIDQVFMFDPVKKNIFAGTLHVSSFHFMGLCEFTSIHFIRVVL